ncbi:TPA: hypothetical protein DIV45_02195 [Patescibacteria group bacterium]|nr:hypothetical protein [Patescibacteria group bacterium]
MKKQVWGYIRYLLLGIITATVLLWSVTVAPAAASPAIRHELTKSSLLRHPGLASALHSSQSDGRVQDRILDSGVAPKAPQNDGAEGLVLSLPFTVESRWESVNNDTPGIVWQTNISSLAFQTIPTQPPLGRGGVTTIPLLRQEGLGVTDSEEPPSGAEAPLGRSLTRREVGEIKFGIEDGQFIANTNDTWFVYGWFGALKAIKQPYNIKYPLWGDRHNGVDFAGREGLEVVSASAGKVVFAGQKIGNTVEIDAGNGYKITYGHLQDISVKRGQILQISDLIGHLGKTGTTNPHLHFQVDLIKKDSRTAINPVSLMEAEWGRVIIPYEAEANQFYTEDQDPLSQPDFLW